MKLHLPIALLAAVLSTVAYGGEVEYTYTGAYTPDGSSTPHEKDFGTGIYNGHIETTFTGNWTETSIYNFTDKNGVVDKGYIAAIDPALNNKEADINTVQSSHLILTGSNTVANKVAAGGFENYIVTGKKEITISDGAYVANVYAGYVYLNATNGEECTTPGYATEHNTHYFPNGENDSNIIVNVDNAYVAQIFAGNWMSARQQNCDNELDSPAWVINENITINIKDGKIGYNGNKEPHPGIAADTPVLSLCYLSSSNAINGKVSYNITGNSIINGSIYAAGGAGLKDVDSYVDSTYVKIADNTKVYGDVYGGGFSLASGASLLVKNGTEIVLAGGEIDGNVYGGGYGGDIVYQKTKIVISGEGTDVNGIIYGGGIDSTSKVDCARILAFDNYTANTGADGYAQVKWTKADGTQQYQNFNALEVNKGKVDLGDISSAFETLKLTSTDVKASSLQGEQIQLNMTTSSFKVDGKLNMAEGSTVTGYPWSELTPLLPDELCDITATEINGNKVEIQGTHLTATEGDISISDSKLDVVHFKAVNGTVSLKNIENIPGRGDGKTVYGVTVDAKGLKLDNTKLSYKVTGSPKVALDSLQLKNESEFLFSNGGEIGLVTAKGENNKLIQAGGDVEIGSIWLYQIQESDGTTINSDLTIEQWSSVNGSMSIGNIVGDGSASSEGASVKIEQKGKGSIDFNGLVMAAPLSVSQTGGGTVTVNKSANVVLQTLNVTNGSTFENLGSVSLEEVAVSFATLLNGATLTVTEVLELGEGANIGVIADAFIETGSAILLGQDAQITGLNSATFSIVFSEDAVCGEYTLSHMLADPTLNGEFQVDIIGGLDTTLAQEIAAAFTKDRLTLQATDANGNLVDMIVWDAQMTNVNGTLTISGSASIPEPTTATLSLLALAALAARRRRK